MPSISTICCGMGRSGGAARRLDELREEDKTQPTFPRWATAPPIGRNPDPSTVAAQRNFGGAWIRRGRRHIVGAANATGQAGMKHSAVTLDDKYQVDSDRF